MSSLSYFVVAKTLDGRHVVLPEDAKPMSRKDALRLSSFVLNPDRQEASGAPAVYVMTQVVETISTHRQ